MNTKDNLIDLIKTAHVFQYAGIADNKKEIDKKKPRFFFTRSQSFIIIISLIVASYLYKGFNDNLAGFIISSLSLFVGIFFSFLINFFDKFKQVNFQSYLNNQEEGIKLKNFFKKVIVLSLYSLIIASVSVILLSATLFYPNLSVDINIRFILCNYNDYELFLIFKCLCVYFYRIIVLYFLANFILLSLYLISAFYDYMISEIDKVRLQDL